MRITREPGGPNAPRSHAWTLVATVALALLLGAALWMRRGSGPAQQYLAGYLIELSLSADNLFVFILVFEHFRIPASDQRRVLGWGFLGAAVLRTAFVLAGASLLARFRWLLVAFGLLIAATGLKLAIAARPKGGPRSDPIRLAETVERILGRCFPISRQSCGPRFTILENGRRMATPLLAALVVLEAADLLFAFDSLPAVLAVTRDGSIAAVANLAAVASLRSLYSVLSRAINRFRYLRAAMAAILIFVGSKMFAEPWFSLSPALSLCVIGSLLSLAALASVRNTGSPTR
jgi:tellurite resistance protein TerC